MARENENKEAQNAPASPAYNKDAKTEATPKTGDTATVTQARQIANSQPSTYATQQASDAVKPADVVVEAQTVIVNPPAEQQLPQAQQSPVPTSEGVEGGVYVVGNRVLSADGVEVRRK